MVKHPNKVTVNKATPKQLAKKIIRTSYDYQRKLYQELSIGYEEESVADKKRGYPQLSILLHILSQTLILVVKIFHKIWNICKSRMEN